MSVTNGYQLITAFGNTLFRTELDGERHFIYDDSIEWDFDVEGCRHLLFLVVLENVCEEVLEGVELNSEEMEMYCECIGINLDYIRRLVKKHRYISRRDDCEVRPWSLFMSLFDFNFNKSAHAQVQRFLKAA